MYTSFEELKKDCLKCNKCPLAATRTNVVFGVGPEDAEVLFIGEGPGENEDLTGQPFVGRGGKLLDQYLYDVDLDRNKNIYIANIVKCRPPKNRDPLGVETEACLPWLRSQTKLINPKIIVCLGRISAKALIRDDFKISEEHGHWTEKNGVQMTALYHPAALLRDPRRRPETFEDLKEIERVIQALCVHTYVK